MTDSPNLHQRILAIMGEVESIQKTSKKQGLQYDYIAHDTVTGVLHPQLVKHRITIFPEVIDKKHDGNRCELVVRFRFFNADNPSDYMDVSTVGYGIDSQDKGPGKAMSYAMKTALLKLFVLESGEPDNEADQTTKHQPDNRKITKALAEATGIISEAQRKRLFAISKKYDWPASAIKSLLAKEGFDSSKDITTAKYKDIIDILEHGME